MKLSIITINLNNIVGLKATIESVISQVFTDYEFIIIDGGSTDGCKDLIQLYKDKFAYWVSENDSGIYNAMNKGIRKAKGTYVLFLNSGDILIDKYSLSNFFEGKYCHDIICADIKKTNKDTSWIKQAPDILNFYFFSYDTLPHQSSLIKKELFQKVGFYKEDLKFVSDWKFYIDAFLKYNASYKHIPKVLCVYNEEGISSQIANKTALLSERDEVLKREYPLLYIDYLDYHKCKNELQGFTNSRAHAFLSKILKSSIYTTCKRFIP